MQISRKRGSDFTSSELQGRLLFYMLVDLKMSQMDGFHVTIRTSATPLSGTFGSIWISLIGTHCETPPVSVNPDQHRLLPGSACTIVIKPTNEVGQVVLLKLRLEAHPGFPDLNWHCQDVQVRHSEDSKIEVFPCNKWIRSEDGYIELRNDKVCLKKEETLAILTAHRERALQNKQQHIRWATFVEGGPHCVDISSSTALDPNLSYVRQRPGTNVHYLKGFAERGTSWKSLQELETFFLFNGGENPIARYVQAHWKEDAFFGYQFLNGSNPLYIKQIHSLPPNLAVTSKMVKCFLPQGSTLKREMESGHVYLLDYEILDHLPANTVNGKQTYMTAPLCLLHYDQQGELKPIAIQLQQAPGPQNPVFLPSDPAPDWLLAKMWVRNSDVLLHQLLSHFLRTHLLGEMCCTATLRQLPEIHPLHQLLMPHLQSTLQINIQARETLLAKNGVFDKAMGCGLDAVALLMARGTQRLRYSAMCVPDDLRSRGLDTLPTCYYAQDALRVWDALYRFVEGWTSLYYCDDEEVQQDCELQNWIGEIFMKGFLGLTNTEIPQSFQTAAELCKFITMIIFSSSALHSAVNFSQLDYNLWIPNSPGVMLRPPPQTKGLIISEDEILSFLPEVNTTCSILTVLTMLSKLAIDYVPLCHYKEWYFRSGATLRLVEKVQRELKKIAKDIKKRNSQLELPYLYLSPDRIENSVTI